MVMEVGQTLSSHRFPRDDHQRDREQQTLLKSISSHTVLISVWEQLATDQFDPWRVIPRQVFTPFPTCVVVSRAGCLGITGVLFFRYSQWVHAVNSLA